MDLPVGAESLHRQLITQISYRGERGLLKGGTSGAAGAHAAVLLSDQPSPTRVLVADQSAGI